MHGIASIQDRLGFRSREEIVGFATIAAEMLQQGMNRSWVTRQQSDGTENVKPTPASN